MAQKYILEAQIPNLDGGSDEPQIPNDEILYTSSSGNIVKPNKTNVFGANIVSNTYSNGKGVIKFDRDVTSIGAWAFKDCKGLTSITIPNSVTSIGSNAFDFCTRLTSITIPDSVKSIGNGAFYGCSGLTSITIPNSVKSIAGSAFSYCIGLTAINIPNSVTTIGSLAFYGNDNLHTIIFDKLRGTHLCDMLGVVFKGCPNLKTVIVDSAEDADVIFKKISQDKITFDIVTFVNVDENGVIVKDI